MNYDIRIITKNKYEEKRKEYRQNKRKSTRRSKKLQF